MKAAGPWMNYFLTYDPLATARQVKVPVLIYNGATDQQVTPDQVPALAKAFRDGWQQGRHGEGVAGDESSLRARSRRLPGQLHQARESSR
jgi:dienelactone hydrolase